MEAKGVAVRQPDVGDGTWRGSRPYLGTANAWGNEQKPSQAGLVGRAGNTQSPPSIIARQVYSVLVCGKMRVYPGRSAMKALECRVRGKLAEG